METLLITKVITGAHCRWRRNYLYQLRRRVVKVSVSNPAMVTVGGLDFKNMYITSARQNMATQQRTENPTLLSSQAPYPGLLESRFIG